MKNTSISLGYCFDQFVAKQVSVGRYKNRCEFTRCNRKYNYKIEDGNQGTNQ